jgi:hypothetical protein
VVTPDPNDSLPDLDPLAREHVGCLVVRPHGVCCVGRTVRQPGWEGWREPCVYRPTEHLRRQIEIGRVCYQICRAHMADLDRRDQLIRLR